MLQTQPRRTPFLARHNCHTEEAAIALDCTARPPNRERQQQSDTDAKHQQVLSERIHYQRTGRANRQQVESLDIQIEAEATTCVLADSSTAASPNT